ncbi:unnamed protein product [Prunus armeniaca]
MSIELHDHYINDYVFVMDRLVDSARDVELLVKSEILESKSYRTARQQRNLLILLTWGLFLFRRNFYFTGLCEKLNDYYRVPWHKWKASLKQD